jgi:hypothetical protein
MIAVGLEADEGVLVLRPVIDVDVVVRVVVLGDERARRLIGHVAPVGRERRVLGVRHRHFLAVRLDADAHRLGLRLGGRADGCMSEASEGERRKQQGEDSRGFRSGVHFRDSFQRLPERN